MAEVSVIMPAYNVASYVGASIESVLAQTFGDWEILVVDDGSTDGSRAIAQAFASREPRIRVLTRPNGGISAARNLALRAARGTFIALLDGDDLWTPEYLETQLGIFAADPTIDIVTGNAWFLGGPQDGQPARPWPDSRPHPALREILADETAVFIMTIMRRRVWETIGAFDEALRTNEDYDFWLRAALAGLKFHRNDRPLGYYRRRDDSLSANDVRMLTGVLLVYDKIRPALAGRPDELRVVEAQVARFERERLAAEARAAIHAGRVAAAADYLSDLYALDGRIRVKLASLLARWAPGVFSRAYQIRRERQGVAS